MHRLGKSFTTSSDQSEATDVHDCYCAEIQHCGIIITTINSVKQTKTKWGPTHKNIAP